MKRLLPFGAILAGLFTSNTPAGDTNDVGYYMEWAVALSGYSAPKSLPRLRRLHDPEIRALYCSSKRTATADCGISGFYNFGDDLFINIDLSPGEIEATIVHELVHYLQVKQGHYTDRCKAEFEANHVEWSYNAVVHGSPDPFVFNRSWYNC